MQLCLACLFALIPSQTFAGLQFGGDKTCVKSAFSIEIEMGRYIERQPEFEARVQSYLDSKPRYNTDAEAKTLDQGAPKSRQQFMNELEQARNTHDGHFGELKIHENVSRIDKRTPSEIAKAGGIFGGNPEKLPGTLVEHTIHNYNSNNHGTSSYTSFSKGSSEVNYKNEFLLGIAPNKIILKDGKILEMNRDIWFKLSHNKEQTLPEEFEGAIAIWETFLYHGRNVEGVEVLKDAGKLEAEVISRGTVPDGYQTLTVYQPLISAKSTFGAGVHASRLPYERAGYKFGGVTNVLLGPYIKFNWQN